MQPILIVQHHPNEGPGHLATWLQARQLAYRIIALDAGMTLPTTLGDIPALVFMGGPMSVNDDYPWIRQELQLIQEAAARRVPVLGHCLGGQLISKALGGTVSKNPVGEIGWHPIQVTPVPGVAWLQQLPQQFLGFHWHGETFSLPSGAQGAMHSEFCAQQAFLRDGLFALQFHVEMTEALVRRWVADNPAELAQPSASVQDAATITTALTAKLTQLHAVADKIYSAWIAHLA
jgi:GMP synthase-like glutamine amidotransferase